MTMITVTVAANATYWSNYVMYEAGETVDVNAFEAERGRYHGVFDL